MSGRIFFREQITYLQLFWLMLIGSCAYVGQYHYEVHRWEVANRDFQEKFEQQFRNVGKQSILVKDITDFEWDEICVYPTSTLPIRYYLSLHGSHNWLKSEPEVYIDTDRFELEPNPSSADECISKDKALFHKSTKGFYLTATEG